MEALTLIGKTCEGIGKLVVIPILRLLGFGAKGIIIGSRAAAWQSAKVVVASGSLFAKLTSLAMKA